MLRVGKIALLREEHTDWLFKLKWSALKTDTASNIIQTEQAIFRNISVFIYTCMHVITINARRIHEFEREKREVYRGQVKGKNRKGEKL